MRPVGSDQELRPDSANIAAEVVISQARLEDLGEVVYPWHGFS